MPVPANWSSSDGQSYVLSFSNQGINQATIRWNPSSNTVPLPPGTKEIGPSGGFVELPNVGRLDIPPNALTQPTLVRISQEFFAPEIMGFSRHSQNPFKISDYISPVVKLSPLGLVLNQPASLHLTTNLARLGNNHPSVMQWYGSLDKLSWEPLGYKSPDVPLDQLSPAEPAAINKLQFVSKQIPASILPDDNFHVMDSNVPDSDSFRTQSTGNSTAHFRIMWRPGDTPNPKEIVDAAELAYQYYASVVTGVHTEPTFPATYQQGRLPIMINKDDPDLIRDKIAGGTYPDRYQGKAIARFIKLGRAPAGLIGGGIAHEVWHVFQYAGLQNGDILFTPSDGKGKWYDESTAGHMAGRVAKKYPSNPVFSVDRNGYQESLKKGLENSTLTINFNPSEYDSPGFFTYLAHQVTGLDGDKVIARINTKVVNNSEQFGPVDRALPSNLGLSHYFNLYATESYVYDRFDIYKPTSGPLAQKQSINSSHTINRPLPIPLTLKPLSAAYYSIDTSDRYIIDEVINGKSVYLKVRASSPNRIACPNGFKDLQLVAIKYPDPQSDHDKYSRSDPTYKQLIPMDGNWQTINGKFLVDYDHIVLAASNGQWREGTLPPACPVNLDVAVAIPQYVPVPTGCGFPCSSNVSALSASLSWPNDPYPYDFPGRRTGSDGLSLGSGDLYTAWPNSTGYNYGVGNFQSGIDANGREIITRLALNFDVVAGNGDGIKPFSRDVHGRSVEMVSQDGKHFTVARGSGNASMGIGYGYTSNTLLDAYRPSSCNPTVSASAAMQATGGELTFNPPTSGEGSSGYVYGTATFNVDLVGQVQVSTNSIFYCSAALPIYDPVTGILTGSTYYGHKSSVSGSGSASVSMTVSIPFVERFF